MAVKLGEDSQPSLNITMRVLPDTDRKASTFEVRKVAQQFIGTSFITMYATPEYRTKMYPIFGMKDSMRFTRHLKLVASL